jgi:hypothetical protein
MRKFLVPILMAGVLMPATAYAERGGRTHGERSESNDNKSNDRPQRSQHVERSNSDAPRVRVERAERPARVERSIDVQASEPTRVRRFERREQAQPIQQVERVEQVRQADRDNDGFVGAIRRSGRDEAVQQPGGVRVHRDRDDRDGFSGVHDRIVRHGDRVDRNHRWSRDWRRNHNYDWRSYRNRYHSLFRLGRYYDPYGWNYRRFSIGFNLWPSYYGSSNWLNDPWQYRLPPAYGPYRWVRYYDDALLVNIYDGQVVDVIYNFFW